MWKRIWFAILPSCHEQSHVCWAGCLHRDASLVQGSSRHSLSFGRGPWTFPPDATFSFWMACWQESPQKHLQGKGWFLFFFSRHRILPEVQSPYKWSSWKTCPRLFWWILILPDSSRNALLPCSCSSSGYLKKIFFFIFCFSDLKRRCCSKHFPLQKARTAFKIKTLWSILDEKCTFLFKTWFSSVKKLTMKGGRNKIGNSKVWWRKKCKPRRIKYNYLQCMKENWNHSYKKPKFSMINSLHLSV